jgi:hypothetical protein
MLPLAASFSRVQGLVVSVEPLGDIGWLDETAGGLVLSGKRRES